MSVVDGSSRSLPRTCPDRVPSAVVWCWPTGAVYAGPPLGLDRHSGAVTCLAVTVGGHLEVATDAREAGDRHRVVLVPARVPHHLVMEAPRVVFTYLDPGSSGSEHALAAATGTEGAVVTGHRREELLVAAAAQLGAEASPEALASFLRVAAPLQDTLADDRVATVLPLLRARPSDPTLSAAALADQLGLSTSRFLRSFRARTGTSFRRYRAWTRLLAAAAAVADGADLTTAAYAGGFASSAHLSTTFRRTFGLPPSRLLAGGASVRVLDGDPRLLIAA